MHKVCFNYKKYAFTSKPPKLGMKVRVINIQEMVQTCNGIDTPLLIDVMYPIG